MRTSKDSVEEAGTATEEEQASSSGPSQLHAALMSKTQLKKLKNKYKRPSHSGDDVGDGSAASPAPGGAGGDARHPVVEPAPNAGLSAEAADTAVLPEATPSQLPAAQSPAASTASAYAYYDPATSLYYYDAAAAPSGTAAANADGPAMPDSPLRAATSPHGSPGPHRLDANGSLPSAGSPNRAHGEAFPQPELQSPTSPPAAPALLPAADASSVLSTTINSTQLYQVHYPTMYAGGGNEAESREGSRPAFRARSGSVASLGAAAALLEPCESPRRRSGGPLAAGRRGRASGEEAQALPPARSSSPAAGASAAAAPAITGYAARHMHKKAPLSKPPSAQVGMTAAGKTRLARLAVLCAQISDLVAAFDAVNRTQSCRLPPTTFNRRLCCCPA